MATENLPNKFYFNSGIETSNYKVGEKMSFNENGISIEYQIESIRELIGGAVQEISVSRVKDIPPIQNQPIEIYGALWYRKGLGFHPIDNYKISPSDLKNLTLAQSDYHGYDLIHAKIWHEIYQKDELIVLIGRWSDSDDIIFCPEKLNQ